MRDELREPGSKRFIYTIRNWRKQVVYVGCTNDISKRMEVHKNANTLVGRFIRKQITDGRKVFYSIEEETTYAECKSREAFFIAKYRHKRLLNQAKNVMRRNAIRWERYVNKKAKQANG